MPVGIAHRSGSGKALFACGLVMFLLAASAYQLPELYFLPKPGFSQTWRMQNRVEASGSIHSKARFGA